MWLFTVEPQLLVGIFVTWVPQTVDLRISSCTHLPGTTFSKSSVSEQLTPDQSYAASVVRVRHPMRLIIQSLDDDSFNSDQELRIFIIDED